MGNIEVVGVDLVDSLGNVGINKSGKVYSSVEGNGFVSFFMNSVVYEGKGKVGSIRWIGDKSFLVFNECFGIFECFVNSSNFWCVESVWCEGVYEVVVDGILNYEILRFGDNGSCNYSS